MCLHALVMCNGYAAISCTLGNQVLQAQVCVTSTSRYVHIFMGCLEDVYIISSFSWVVWKVFILSLHFHGLLRRCLYYLFIFMDC